MLEAAFQEYHHGSMPSKRLLSNHEAASRLLDIFSLNKVYSTFMLNPENFLCSNLLQFKGTCAFVDLLDNCIKSYSKLSLQLRAEEDGLVRYHICIILFVTVFVCHNNIVEASRTNIATMP